MDDFPGLFAKDFGIKPQGKSAPMAPPKNPSSNYGFGSDFTRSESSYGNTKSSSNSIFDGYGGQPKYSSESRASTAQTSSFDYGSFFNDPKPPVFDKPVYDDDIFDGLTGIKTSFSKPAVKYDDVFEVSGSSPKHKSLNGSPFDDLLGNLGSKETEVKVKSERVKAEKDAPFFDDLLAGFGSSSSAASARSTLEAGQTWKPASNSSKTGSNLREDPFVVSEPTPDPANSSSGLFTDPSEVTSELNGFGKSRVESSSGSRGVFDDSDPLDRLGKSASSVSSEINKRGKDRSPLNTESRPQTPATKEQNDVDHDNRTKKRVPSVDNFLDSHQPVFDIPSMSTDFHRSFGRATSPPPYANVGSNETSVHTASRSEENLDAFDDVWLTVSEVPLFTQPTSAPPPSRPPPPRPPRVSKTTTGSFSSINAKKKVDDISSFQNSTQYPQSSQSARAAASSPVTSQIDELEDFAVGRAWNNDDQAEFCPGDDFGADSVAAASAAAMKEAMDRAEAKFRHAKEMRERDNLKAAARTKEGGQRHKDERVTEYAFDREVRENEERLERERQQREREEEEREKRRRELERERESEREREEQREQRRLEKERERVREMEREKERARQAVERATREARERAAAEARARAERAAVGKAASEARERAERAAVQRAQAEARERAAAEAKDRAERAAAEARERETRERTAVAKAKAEAEAEAKLRAERSAAERAAAESRAAASARDPVFDGQNKGGPEVARRTSVGSSSNMKKASSTANVFDDLVSIFGAAESSSGEFQDVEGETEERRRARLERHQRTQERAAKALAEKNQRDLQVQREQAERHRIGETLDVEIKRWAAGKEGNLRALLSTLQYVLWPECGWQPVSLTDLITAAAVKKAYRKATLCIHPDKVQQKGANLQQKYVSEKVFDMLKEAWNKFNSEELF